MLSSRFAFLSLVLGAVGYVNASPLNSADPTTAHSLTNADFCDQPKPCETGQVCSTESAIDGALTTYAPETSVFWGGHYVGKSIVGQAVRCANLTHGATVGMVLCKDPTIRMPVGGPGPLWDYASKGFAELAKGKALVAIGETLFERATFFNIELPALKKNGNIRSVVSVDVGTADCTELCNWYCHPDEKCPKEKACIIQTVPGNTPP